MKMVQECKVQRRRKAIGGAWEETGGRWERNQENVASQRPGKKCSPKEEEQQDEKYDKIQVESWKSIMADFYENDGGKKA